jgi:hypothetical protein
MHFGQGTGRAQAGSIAPPTDAHIGFDLCGTFKKAWHVQESMVLSRKYGSFKKLFEGGAA